MSESDCSNEFQRFAANNILLSGFPTAVDLLIHLHRHEDQDRVPSSDTVLYALLSAKDKPLTLRVWRSLLLLAFIPTVHRTTSQLVAVFPSLARDDISQNLIAALLEFLDSKELNSRRSHFAFAVARKLRRCAFRWAIRESRSSFSEDLDGDTTTKAPIQLNGHGLQPENHLFQFLDDCQRRGWLTAVERQLIVESKLQGISCPELAKRDGHSVVAIRHRVNRLILKLRRIANVSERTDNQQMHLFPK
jgi:DNA-directed RNA polymerase specialized sigma24 family protein